MISEKLGKEIVLSLGNQLVDWTDDTSKTWVTAEELDIDNQIVIEFIQNNLEVIFRDFDGVDTAVFSYEGWAYYESLC